MNLTALTIVIAIGMETAIKTATEMATEMGTAIGRYLTSIGQTPSRQADNTVDFPCLMMLNLFAVSLVVIKGEQYLPI